MTTHFAKQSCACPCGDTTFEVNAKPIARFICHCTICQSLYKRPFADFTVMLAKHVEYDENQNISFGKYRRPPALNRGVSGKLVKKSYPLYYFDEKGVNGSIFLLLNLSRSVGFLKIVPPVIPATRANTILA